MFSFISGDGETAPGLTETIIRFGLITIGGGRTDLLLSE